MTGCLKPPYSERTECMPEALHIILLTTIAGLCIPIGGAMATIENLFPKWHQKEYRHFLIALGGGILIGSVTEVLVPEGIKSLNHSMFSVPIIFAGGLTFFAIERQLALQRREAPQLIGMLLDYIPEALALGGLVALGSPTALLLAVLIGLQNLPEGFNSYRELIHFNGNNTKRTLLSMLALVPLGPIAGLIGYFFLASSNEVLGAIMLFSSGGILYLIFQDIAPQSRLDKHWFPPLGAIIGFCIAVFSHMLIVS